MRILELSPPWMIYYEKIKALFNRDPEIKIYFNDEEMKISLYVENGRKADALSQLLPLEKSFGSVVIGIDIIPANGFTKVKSDPETLFTTAFEGSSVLDFVKTIEGVLSNPIIYVVFNKTVVQYYNDDLGDYFGQCSTLYQDLAKEVFEEKEGVFYCTNRVDQLKLSIDHLCLKN